MPLLDPELAGRLASWLAYHLSSFSYQWPWDRWQAVTDRPPHDPQRAFCAALLARLLRLADYPIVFKVGVHSWLFEVGVVWERKALGCLALPGGLGWGWSG